MSDKPLVGIVGTGVIGTGWAARFLAHGYPVIAWDPHPQFAEKLQAEIARLWPTLQRAGMEPSADQSKLKCVGKAEDVSEVADFIQESAPEVLEVKQKLLTELDAVAPESVVIASSSSGLLPTELQSQCRYPQRILVGHPFNPVYLLPLVELVGGNQSSAEAIESATQLYQAVGMKPLHVRREIEGYLSDRLQEALWREILHLLNDDIATTQELDDAIVYGPGLRWALMGTCLTFHLAGGERGMAHMLEQFGPALKLPWTHLQAPELTEALKQKLIDGTQAQAGEQSISHLETVRDNFLIELLELVEKYQGQLRPGD